MTDRPIEDNEPVTNRSFTAAVFMGLAVVVAASTAHAEDKVMATVDGRNISESELKLAEFEIGGDLGNLPPETRRRVLVEYLIENQLFADAAEREKLSSGKAFEDRLAYWRRRAMRDTFFEKAVKGEVGEGLAKTFYEDQVKGIKPEEEVQARHILVDTEEKAKEISDKVAKGGDFAALAKENSKDPGSKDDGGMLGFFGRGQMVPQFEEAVFKLKKGEVSPPVKSQFGFHVIKLEDRRDKKLPTFDEVKDRILNSMIQRRAQDVANELRTKAKIVYVDPEIKKMVDEQEKGLAEQKKAMESQIKAQIEKMEAEGKTPPPVPGSEKK
ncbi:MAG: peptidylprolyl isomerase [Verrucomicrobiae bacterium]|nr:peptidylprolyl isomerase [Verrucomicrobiae bacterium]